MYFIKLTENDGDELWLVPDRIISLEVTNRKTTVTWSVDNSSFSRSVKETPTEIIAKINDRPF